MDSSIANVQSKLEAIKGHISDGSLDAQALHNCLIHEIDHEISKPSEEVDMEYVEMCEDLLERLASENKVKAASHYFHNLEAIRQTIMPRKQGLAFNRLRPMAAFCAMLLVLFSGVLFQHAQVRVTQSPDGEQYIIQGAEVTPDLTANAARYQESGFWDTEDWNEAIKLYGSTPCVPTWVPKGWRVERYSIDISESFVRFAVTYTNATGDGHLIFDTVAYDDTADLRAELEQNEGGEYRNMGNGISAYITNNMDNLSACWIKGQTKYVLSGTITENDLWQCIQSIQ